MEQHAYCKYIDRLKQYSADHDLGDSSTDLLWSIARNFPSEVLGHIAKHLWPCALQKPVTILGDGESLKEFWERKEHNTVYIMEYRGEPVSVTEVAFLGSNYVGSLSIDRKLTTHGRGELLVAIIRDSMGIKEVNFEGKFLSSRQNLWYKVIRTSADHLRLRVRVMVCVILCYSVVAAY